MSDFNEQSNAGPPQMSPSGQPMMPPPFAATAAPAAPQPVGQQFEPVAKPNVALGIVAGIVLGVLAAAIYAAVATLTGREIGYLALLIGVAVAGGMSVVGKRKNFALGLLAAVVAAVMFVVAILLAGAGVVSKEFGVGFIETLQEILKVPVDVLKAYFEDAMSWLFLLLAVVPAFIGASGMRDNK